MQKERDLPAFRQRSGSSYVIMMPVRCEQRRRASGMEFNFLCHPFRVVARVDDYRDTRLPLDDPAVFPPPPRLYAVDSVLFQAPPR